MSTQPVAAAADNGAMMANDRRDRDARGSEGGVAPAGKVGHATRTGALHPSPAKAPAVPEAGSTAGDLPGASPPIATRAHSDAATTELFDVLTGKTTQQPAGPAPTPAVPAARAATAKAAPPPVATSASTPIATPVAPVDTGTDLLAAIDQRWQSVQQSFADARTRLKTIASQSAESARAQGAQAAAALRS